MLNDARCFSKNNTELKLRRYKLKLQIKHSYINIARSNIFRWVVLMKLLGGKDNLKGKKLQRNMYLCISSEFALRAKYKSAIEEMKLGTFLQVLSNFENIQE